MKISNRRACGNSAALPDIRVALGDANAHVREATLTTLGEAGPAMSAAMADILPCITAEETPLTLTAVTAALRVDAGSLAVYLEQRWLTEGEGAVKWTLPAVGEAGAQAKPLVPLLIRLLREGKDQWTRASAADALAALGPVAADAVPALTAALNDPADSVRRYAATALERMAR